MYTANKNNKNPIGIRARAAFLFLFFIMVRTGLSMLQWNARGLGLSNKKLKQHNLNSKVNNLNKLISDLNFPDIICIQEPLIKENHVIDFPNYNHEIIFKSQGCRGLLTLVKNTHTYKVLKTHSNKFITSHTLEVHIKNQTKMHVTNYYRHWENRNNSRNLENKTIEQQIGLPLKQNLSEHVILGDFNAHHISWGSNNNTKIGKIFAKLIEEGELALLNTGECTRIGQRSTESDTSIDLSITENMEGIRVQKWEVLENDLGSDHLPIHLGCGTTVKNNFTPPKQIRFKTKNANWDLFKAETRSYNWESCRDDNIEEYSKKVIAATTELAKKCIPHSDPKSIKPLPKNAKKSVPWWDADCQEAKELKMRALKKWQSDRTDTSLTDYKFRRNQATKLVNKKQNQFFRKQCTSMNETTSENDVWKLVSSMEGRQKLGQNTVILKDKDGNDVVNNKDKANLLGNHYESISSDSNLDTNFLERKQQHKINNPHLFNKQDNTRDPINLDFTIQEYIQTLNNKQNSATGEDGLSYEILKKMHLNAQKEILRLFNLIWNKGTIPQNFKHAIVIPVLKPNKPKNDPSSYRPISLTSHLGKILETMYTNRLNQKLEAFRKLNKLQSGFRRKRQTLDQLARLIHNAEKCRNMNKTTVAVLLDLEKAFDLLWREGALDALQKLNITGRAFNYIQDFLKNRTFQVRVGESLSDSKTQENGVPQGAVLSPTIFNILIDAVATIPEKYPHIQLGQFADDTALWVDAEKCPAFGPDACNKLRKLIEKPSNELIKILTSIGFKVNVKKTQVIFFNRPLRGREFVRIDNKSLEAKNSVTYLGMTLDTRLTYTEHIDNLINKGEKSLHILRNISGSKWGVQCSSRLLLYKNYILPKIVYGEEFFDKGSITSLNKLQKFQNKTLNIISNTRKSLPIAARHFICQLPPLDIRRQTKILHLYNRLQYNKDNPTNTIFIDQYENTTHNRNKNKIKQTFTENVKDLLNVTRVINFPVNSMPKPLEHWAIKLIDVDITLLEKVKNITNLNDKKNIVLEHLRNFYSNYIHVYCDGAKNRHTGATGIGFFDITNGNFYKAKTNTHIHIDNVEVAAASYSAKYLNNTYLNKNSLIVTDSLRTCRRLKTYRDNDSRLDLINIIHKFSHNIHIHKGSLSILWIPAHIGLEGHDIADQLAKEGTESENFQDIKYDIRELKDVVESAYTIPSLQAFWSNSRTGTHGSTVISNFYTKCSINNFTNVDSITQLLFRLIFGTAKFHIVRNRGCESCNSNLSIDHAVLNCQLFNTQREIVRDALSRIGKELTLTNVLNPNCHHTVREHRNLLIREINERFTI